MMTSEAIKKIVKDKYGEIVKRASEQSSCGCGCSPDTASDIFSDDYAKLEGYAPDADLGLGCGLPTEFAQIQPGQTVLDLGAGAGNDCFVARALVGDEGKVIGVDMTDSMVSKAKQNAEKLGYNNVEFHLGEIESLPLQDDQVDVVVSNCVLNLVPDKSKAFAETFRVLRPGGHFSISDIVTGGELPTKLKEAAALYVGCVAGALTREAYLSAIEQAGFTNIQVQKEKQIEIPEALAEKYLSKEEILEFKERNPGIYSITVYAEKPATTAK